MGNSSDFRLAPAHDATNGVLSKRCVENKGLILAPQVGLEPTTLRLTAECSTIELLRSNVWRADLITTNRDREVNAQSCLTQDEPGVGVSFSR